MTSGFLAIYVDLHAQLSHFHRVFARKRIKTKKNFEHFNRYYNDSWYEEMTDSYHDQWWGFTGVDAVTAWGVHLQFIYINSEAGIVIAKHSSDPEAEGVRTGNETPLVLHAIAKYLTQQATN